MEIIRDANHKIHLHPFLVYFLVDDDTPIEIADALNKLGKYKGFSRGIFKFKTIQHGKPNEKALTPELASKLEGYNAIVRLLNDHTSDFCYAVEHFDFKSGPEALEDSIQKFIVAVCEQDLKQLQAYPKNDSHIAFVQKMRQHLEDAINLKGFRRNVIESLVNDIPCNLNHQHSGLCDMPPEFDRVYREYKNSKDVWEWVEKYMANKNDSDHEAFYAFNDYAISLEIRSVRLTINRREREDFVIIFKINGEEQPYIHLGSRDQAMVFYTTVLKKAAGEKMYRRYLRQESNVYAWLNSVYDVLRFRGDRDFNDWFNSILVSSRPIDQGKSQVNKAIAKNLDRCPKEVIERCQIETIKTENGSSYFDIGIDPHDITLPDDFNNIFMHQ